MDDLIILINQLHQYRHDYEFDEINYPEIIVVGAQSSGKSSVMERIIGYDILPKDFQLATKCPVLLQMINRDISRETNHDIKAIIDSADPIFGSKHIYDKLKDIMSDIEEVSEKPIMVKLFSSFIPTLTMIDVPGTIKNDGDLKSGTTQRIMILNEHYIKNENAIILAVSAANVDLANSDSIALAQKFDRDASRTFHVLTKVDIMDQGTDVRIMLNSNYINKTLGNICVVNRSQNDVSSGISMAEATQKETNFFQINYPDICSHHGIEILKETLAQTLSQRIKQQIPTIKVEIKKRMAYLNEKINSMDIDTDKFITKTVISFSKAYKEYVKGNHKRIYNNMVGGARISQVMYEEYRNKIEKLKLQNVSDIAIDTTIKNTCGYKKLSYSVESTVKLLTAEEIKQCNEPTLNCLSEVRDLLIEFVEEVLKDLGIEMYADFSDVLTTKMNNLIDENFKKTEVTLRNFIQSETDDIFCSQPNIYDYDFTKRKYLEAPKDKSKTSQYSKDKYKPSKEDLNDLLDILDSPKFKTSDSSKSKTPDSSKSKSNENSGNQIEIQRIKALVKEYFNEARENIKRNVPKHIHVLYINVILDRILEILLKMSEEQIDILPPYTEEKIEKMKNELKTLEGIRSKLPHLIR